MDHQKSKLGFCALVSIVISSQLGSGVFVLPSSLAKYGVLGLWGWLVSVAGAIALALIFSDMSSRFTNSGGPHTYVLEAFGKSTSFFTGWTYWMISWASNSILLVTAMKYLSSIIGETSITQALVLEVSMLFAITCISIVRVNTIGWIGFCLTILKYVPLFILPLIFFMFFDSESFSQVAPPESTTAPSALSVIATTSLLTFWGFVGVECATAATCNVRTPKKTIPRALAVGTICVALVYVLNTISVTGVVGFEELAKTEAPYALVMDKVFGSAGDIIISVLAIVVCLSTLNSWIFTSGQIAHCAYMDGLFPSAFGKLNKHDAPIAALAFSFCGSIPFLVLERIEQDGFDKLISRMSGVFMCVYLVCCLAYIKLIKKWYIDPKARWHRYVLSCSAAAFCLFALAQDIIPPIVILAVFVVIGIPILLRNRRTSSNTGG